MSSWFGGPTSTSKHRNSSPHMYSKRSPSPTRRYFVRSSSPGAQSTRSAFTSLFTGNLASSFSGGGGAGRHNASTSSYRRRPRDGFISRIVRQIKKYLRDLIAYARRNPLKLALMVLPLVTGGALAGILKTVGISLPAGLAGLMGARRGGGGAGGFGGGGGQEGFGLEQAVSVAKMFM